MPRRPKTAPNLPPFRLVAPADLTPYKNNPRTHPPAQIEAIKRSIREFGFTLPVLVGSDGVILAGHGRVLAALALGMEEVPVIELAHLTPAQRRAYVIADNQIAQQSGWDDGLLKLELGALQLDGFDLSLTGFSLIELGTYLADSRQSSGDENAIPGPQAVVATRPGDIWQLGNHRLGCGDSADAAFVARIMEGGHADLCFTSPPYAQQRQYGAGVGDWDALMRGVFAAIPAKPDAQVLVNLGLVHQDGEWQPYWDGWIAWMREQGWRRFGWYVWDQGSGLPGDWFGRLAPSHEFVFHFNRSAEKPRKTKAKRPDSIGRTSHHAVLRDGDAPHGMSSIAATLQPNKIPDSVIRVQRQRGPIGKRGDSHPAVFSVAFADEIIAAFSDIGDVLWEPFCGSGTQIISAEKLGRLCRSVEISPTYVDVAARRWQDFTGEFAILEATGQAFDEVAAARAKQAAE